MINTFHITEVISLEYLCIWSMFLQMTLDLTAAQVKPVSVFLTKQLVLFGSI